MILLILKIALLLAAIVIPLRPRKSKAKPANKLKVDTDTKNAHYAINENGSLEEINKLDLTDH